MDYSVNPKQQIKSSILCSELSFTTPKSHQRWRITKGKGFPGLTSIWQVHLFGSQLRTATPMDTLYLFNLILNLLVDILQGLSIGGAFLTILTFSLFKEIRTYPIKLIIYLCWCIFLAQSFFIISFYSSQTFFCIPAAMLIHFFFLADFFWSFCVAFNFYQMIVRRNREAEAMEKWYHIISWSVAGVFVFFVAIADQYGDLGGVCYITSALAIFAAFFLPGLIVISANTVIFFFVSREIHDTLSSAPQADKREKKKEYRVYLSIFVSIGLSWIFGWAINQ